MCRASSLRRYDKTVNSDGANERTKVVTLLFGVSTSPGFVYARVGLVPAMASHFVYDVTVLQGYQRTQKTHPRS